MPRHFIRKKKKKK